MFQQSHHTRVGVRRPSAEGRARSAPYADDWLQGFDGEPISRYGGSPGRSAIRWKWRSARRRWMSRPLEPNQFGDLVVLMSTRGIGFASPQSSGNQPLRSWRSLTRFLGSVSRTQSGARHSVKTFELHVAGRPYRRRWPIHRPLLRPWRNVGQRFADPDRSNGFR